MAKTFIGIPSYSDEIPILMSNFLADVKLKYNVVVVFKIGMPVHKARNFIVEEFLKSDCENLLMIDADNPISAEGFGRLLEDIKDHHIVC